MLHRYRGVGLNLNAAACPAGSRFLEAVATAAKCIEIRSEQFSAAIGEGNIDLSDFHRGDGVDSGTDWPLGYGATVNLLRQKRLRLRMCGPGSWGFSVFIRSL